MPYNVSNAAWMTAKGPSLTSISSDQETGKGTMFVTLAMCDSPTLLKIE